MAKKLAKLDQKVLQDRFSDGSKGKVIYLFQKWKTFCNFFYSILFYFKSLKTKYNMENVRLYKIQ
jgi:hypothetical protein